MSNRGRFQKGESGNPGGRPKMLAEVRDLAREHSAEAIAELLRIMREGTNDQARIAAAREILDRGFGRPLQAIVTDEDSEMIRYMVSDEPLSEEEWMAEHVTEH